MTLQAVHGPVQPGRLPVHGKRHGQQLRFVCFRPIVVVVVVLHPLFFMIYKVSVRPHSCCQHLENVRNFVVPVRSQQTDE